MAEIKELTLDIQGRTFEIWDIQLTGGEILADIGDAKDDNKSLMNLFILSESDAETKAEENDALSGFTDEMGSDGEHTTVDYYIPFEAYFSDTTTEDRVEMYNKELVQAISQAIKEKKI